MPNVVVNCTFNPPHVTVMGAALRPEALRSLESALPRCTTTSQTGLAANSASSAANGLAPQFAAADYPPQTWRVSLGPHYCDQRGRAAVFAALVAALAAEGFELRTTNAVTLGEKDVTRLFFWRQAESSQGGRE